MDALIELLGHLPAWALLAVLTLAVIAGLGYIIYLLVQQGRATNGALVRIQTNHLHELPEIAETLRRIETQQGAMAAALLTQLSDIRTRLEYVAAKVNGKS